MRTLTAAVCLLGAAAAQAQQQASAPPPGPQSRVSGPFSGLFGSTADRPQNAQSLQLRGSLFGAYQRTELPDDVNPSLLDPRFRETQSFAGASSSLAYSFMRMSGASTLNFGGGGFLSTYSIAPKEPQYGAFASGGLSTPLTRRISFSVSGQSTYGTMYQFNPILGGTPLGGGATSTTIPGTSPFGDPGLTPGLNLTGLKLRILSSNAQAGVTAALGRRSSVAVTSNYFQTKFLDLENNDFANLWSSATFSYRLYRRLAVTVGYQQQQQMSAGDRPSPPPTHDLIATLNYGDALSLRLARRTTLSMSVSMASARSYRGQNQLQVLGSAGLNHSLGRSWSTGLTFARTLGFMAGFDDAILQDTATLFLGGQFSRRVSLTSTGAYGRGYIGMNMNNHFDYVNGSSALKMAISRRIGGFAQYLYYRSEVPQGASTLPLLTSYQGHSAMVGLTIFAPLYNNPRVRQ